MGRRALYIGVTCSIDGCSNNAKTRGWCEAHYSRFKRHGDPTAGYRNKGESLSYLKEIVLHYENDECLIWPYVRSGSGYAHLKIDGVDVLVHRFVCERENGPPPSPTYEAAHSCGKGHLGCVSRKHLSWKTKKDNAADKHLHGTALVGSANHFSKLTEEQVVEILDHTGGEKHVDVAKRYGVTPELIGMIKGRKIWRHLPSPRPLYREDQP